jgi:NADH pyrophosphatase NudC (nudix superfamily)
MVVLGASALCGIGAFVLWWLKSRCATQQQVAPLGSKSKHIDASSTGPVMLGASPKATKQSVNFCSQCGAKGQEGVKYCSHCGTPMESGNSVHVPEIISK